VPTRNSARLSVREIAFVMLEVGSHRHRLRADPCAVRSASRFGWSRSKACDLLCRTRAMVKTTTFAIAHGGAWCAPRRRHDRGRGSVAGLHCLPSYACPAGLGRVPGRAAGVSRNLTVPRETSCDCSQGFSLQPTLDPRAAYSRPSSLISPTVADHFGITALRRASTILASVVRALMTNPRNAQLL